jgi:hypothetical protein
MAAAGGKFGRERFNFVAVFEARPYLTASVLFHLLLLAGLFAWGSHRITQSTSTANQAIASSHEANAEQAYMQRRVRDMARIRDMLEDSARKDSPAKRASDEPRKSEPPADQPAREKSASELLEDAKAIDAAIKKLEQKFKAADLAAALKIPEEEALKKIVAADIEKAKQRAAEKSPVDLAKLEQQAKATLANRKWQLEKQQNGIDVNANVNASVNTNPNAAQSLAQQSAELAIEAGVGDNGPIPGGGTIDVSGGTFKDPRRYGTYVAAPSIDKANLKLATGNVIGKGGVLANRIWINRWYLIGPFEGDGQWSLKSIYPPEKLVDLDAVYVGKFDRAVKWQYVNDGSYPFVPEAAAENAVYYAYTEIVMDEERDLWINIGADDDSRMWFNRQLIWASGDSDKPWYRTHFRNLTDDIAHQNLSEGKRKVHFKKGRNTMLFKLYNSSGAMFFSVVVEGSAT